MQQHFNKCFLYGLTPSVWLKAIINPIPKGALKDPYLPMNYRGISLLSCTSKIYSGVLNNRITDYFENVDVFVDEQNDFRKGRSCEDHVFVLNSFHFSQRGPVYTTLIHIEKIENLDLCCDTLISSKGG